ncbi:MAG: glycine/betaine/sarcosine/D-proline family reductase selenoprotein B [Proteobacteria bacterium]|nr:glycine/betaine/sarcosine/D-proline family reductase selenoprotein B [Pseudomonadota bacterium]MBU1585393.1 glycine/betaine/sarcosine/D-proline family reductase selenoprotein B [Pseudomonadota bacterium]MBU2453363.1 glycine/betaine/sarcosine/D-proline family reductase selenoprotein B [Pseudomonadota bacterium]
MEKENKPESFETFIKSFFYGNRSDLSFKFMSDLTSEDASIFIQNLFRDIVDAIDDGDLSKVRQRMLQGQIQGYKHQKNFEYDHGPFHPLKKPLSSMKLTLLTSSGHFLKGYDPMPLGVENMTQAEAERRVFDFLKEEPCLSEIPFESTPEDLMVRHGGYDIRAALKDPNVSFPFQRMVELRAEGVFKELTSNAYSFVGACSQKRLLTKTLPDWVDRFVGLGVDAVVLVPV